MEEITLENKQPPLKSDKLRDMPIGKLLLTMALPAILSMLVQSLYNIVDSVFVSRLSDLNNNAFDAVSIATPFCMIVTSMGIGIGGGANIYISRKLGERNHDDANNAAKTSILMAIIAWVVFLVLGLTISRPFIALFTDNAEIIEMGTSYLTIYLAFSVGAIVEMTGIRLLQATGNMKIPMISQLCGALTNIILDPIFIFGYLGVPAMGVTGAAIATIIGQWVASAIVLGSLLGKKQDISIKMKGFRPQAKYFGGIAKMGAPLFVMNAAFSFVNMAMNSIVGAYENGISVLNAQFKLQSFIYMPIFGLNQGTIPILSYNYGANDRKRFLKTYKYAVISAGIFLTLGFILFQTIPDTLVKIFNPTPDMERLAVIAFRRMSLSFIPSAVGILTMTMVQSLNLPVASLAATLCRQVGFILLGALILNAVGGLNSVWFTYPIADVLSLIIFVPIGFLCYKKQFAKKDLAQNL